MDIKQLAHGIKLGATKFWHSHGADVCTYVGVCVMAGGTVWACRQSTKLPDILKEEEGKLEMVKDDPKAVKKVKMNGKVRILKLYAAPVGTFIAGTAGVLVGHHHLKKEVAAGIATGAALMAEISRIKDNTEAMLLEKGFSKEEVDGMMTDIQEGVVVKEFKDDKGNTVEKRACKISNPQYRAKLFEADYNTSTSCCFVPNNPMHNLKHLDNQRKIIQMRLDAYEGEVIFMNEIAEMIGLEKDQVWQNAGYYHEPGKPAPVVSFGIERLMKGEIDPEQAQWLNESIPLHFNCQPFVLDKLPCRTDEGNIVAGNL